MKNTDREILKVQDLTKHFGGFAAVSRVHFHVNNGETVGLVGPNGAGKTTFLKTILEQIEPLSGEVQLGASLTIGYFAQAHEGLQPERTLVQEIDSAAPEMMVAEIRDYLARFLFSGEDVFKKVAVLSGGERGRLPLRR